jgi:hypothetical protein
MILGFAVLVCGALFSFAAIDAQCHLTIDFDGTPALVFKGNPILAYGPSPQHILTYLPRASGDDYQDWVTWAKRYRIRNIRSYPPSIMVEPPAIDLFERALNSQGKFDLTRFNEHYFRELRKACQEFERAGIIVHLQLWQAVHWKKAWSLNYYNSANNVNSEISRHAGPNQFSTIANPALVKHQIAYVHRILDATADIGNVFYDIMNEIGNGTSPSREWLDAMVDGILEWEKKKGIDVLLTLNDEGGKRLGDYSITHPHLDLVVEDRGRYEEHVATRMQSRKPTISVRNIDFSHSRQETVYFYGKNNLEINTDPGLQARGRKYWWRMYMAGVVAASGYADSVPVPERSPFWRVWHKALSMVGLHDGIGSKRVASYRLNTLAEDGFLNFIKFTDMAGHPRGLHAASEVVSGHPATHSYCLQNREKAILYLESPNGEAGHFYPSAKASLKGLILDDGQYDLLIYHPASGEQINHSVEILGGNGKIHLPPFKDDLAILIR